MTAVGLSLRPVEEIDRRIRRMNDAMQVIRARAVRIAQIRQMLATLNDDERLSIASELLGTNTEELLTVLEVGSRTIQETSSTTSQQATTERTPEERAR